MAKASKEEQRKAPILRFKGFTDNWEQRKLGKVATFINGRAYKQNELLDSGKYKVLRVGNFYTNDSWYYSNLELADKYYIDKGDLVYTWSATFGPHIWDGEKVIYHYHIWKIELSKFLDRDFTLQILEADKAKLLANTNGSTMIHVTKKDMESKVISLPIIEEQKQIGLYLTKFDTLIALYERKVRLYKLIFKKAINSIVNVSSSSEISLGNIFDVITDYVANGSFKSLRENVKHYSSEEYAYLIRLQDFNNHWKGPWLYTDKKGFDFLKKSKLQTGDIILSNVGSVGKIFQVPSLDKPMTLAPNSILLKTEKNNEDYMYYLMLSSNFQRKLKEKVTPGVQEKINKTDLKKIKIKLPSKNQQDSIAELLKTINSYIKHLQQKASYLKDIKKELLNTMFI